MKYFIVISLACLATALALPAAIEQKGAEVDLSPSKLGLHGRTHHGGGAHGGSHHTGASGGSHGSSHHAGGSGQKFDEGFNKESHTSFTNSERESGRVSSGKGAHGSGGQSGGSHGNFQTGGAGFGTGERGSRRVSRGSY